MKHNRIIYLSHGGGPLPILGDPGHRRLIDFLTTLPGTIPKPKGVVVFSAHWEENPPQILNGRQPELFYDYFGFPDETYSLNFPAPGDPALAGELQELLSQNNIPAELNPQRGFDHGLFIPLMLMYPEADIPMTQISLIRGLDPRSHLELGRTLGKIGDRSLLFIGSGFSFHNMRAFNWGPDPKEDPNNDAFQEWLIDVCTGDHSIKERENRLLNWKEAPKALYCHPREEHLLPLHICCAMAGTPGKVVFDDQILGKRAVAFLWDGASKGGV